MDIFMYTTRRLWRGPTEQCRRWRQCGRYGTAWNPRDMWRFKRQPSRIHDRSLWCHVWSRPVYNVVSSGLSEWLTDVHCSMTDWHHRPAVACCIVWALPLCPVLLSRTPWIKWPSHAVYCVSLHASAASAPRWLCRLGPAGTPPTPHGKCWGGGGRTCFVL